ncbi:Afadin and alpha-actinin-binding-domain-containing protein [Yarrowia lipolytica]|jgi:hypothetical protein|uniref:YALI0F15059p n=2 Tax=Yarrowia lipolytica TaxID=4952 RepID=Q6C1M1_YARLI|nr:YALI0F15059p [Yarrowia lipolytica CLIB122]AOW07204.1 hypothetical protein YALI1_F20123g [Yarrowia lipolytica]KAB8281722.1 Afadin and alpha-actinin-binding-domain-containing protein [Yarrowia lipolytica]KAE8171943.1 Afadin and alpha-actinin-binding-domain-containing protein [Yarrowia lipolytica]KAJ8055683.1 Afadin and alpha-actinin-binding-domain-containing protein [Yarrowia lipolytica]QNQ01130.1 Hypothetical protein YALI2_F00675g [Yarrowia lipolytica]|eukprot:XP_505441.1 YALI0F15059p [Yarrowia lipolytica CLIB122]
MEAAAEFINHTLVSKGYLLSDRLKFATVSKTPLENVEENDMLVINTIYSLLQSLEKDSKAEENRLRRVADLEHDNDRLRNEIRALHRKNHDLHTRLAHEENALQNAKREIARLEAAAKNERGSLTRAKMAVDRFKQQSMVEMRKRDVRLERMRELARKGTAISSDSLVTFTPPSPDVRQLDNELIRDNKMLLSLIYKTIDDIDMLKRNALETQPGEYKAPTEDDLNSIVQLSVSELQHGGTFSLNRTDDLNELAATMADNLSSLRDALSQRFTLPEVDHDSEVAVLKRQLHESNENWHKAVKTMEEWKAYRGEQHSTR